MAGSSVLVVQSSGLHVLQTYHPSTSACGGQLKMQSTGMKMKTQQTISNIRLVKSVKTFLHRKFCKILGESLWKDCNIASTTMGFNSSRIWTEKCRCHRNQTFTLIWEKTNGPFQSDQKLLRPKTHHYKSFHCHIFSAVSSTFLHKIPGT